jgi:two-component system OmpR family sensor kinase
MGRLFWKFFACILLAQLTATVGVGAVFWLRDQASAQASGTATHAIDAGPPAEFMLDAAAATLAHGGSAALRDLAGATTRHSVFVIDAAGNDVLKRPVTAAMRSQAGQLLQDGRGVVRMLTAPDGARYMVFVPALARHGHAGGPPGSHGPPGGRHFLPYITMLVATFASLLFAALLAWYFSRPIRALRSAFEAAAAGNLAPRFTDFRGVRADELADLGRDFDRMTARLAALMDGQRRLLHDVSHELRSPLARLQAAIGLAHQQPQKVASSLERIERESIRMDKLVGQLLTLSRLEASDRMPASEDVALMDLVDGIVADARFEAEQQGRRIDVRGEAQVNVHCAPDLLWSAIENVIRNAIKHSPEGGTVTVELGADCDAVRIAVLDCGPGVDPAELGAIFAPFYRSGPGAAGVDGHGLGLAIAQRVVDAHGGAILASNREGGGLRVAITLPLKR